MGMSIRGSVQRRVAGVLAAGAVLASFAAAPVQADTSRGTTSSTVRDWNLYAANALTAAGFVAPCASEAPTVASIHMAMTEGAVYDAVNAIDKRHQPYLEGLPNVSSSASMDAAAATAAHDVLIGLAPVAPVPALCPAIIAQLDAALASTLGGIPNGPAKTDGIAIGAAAADAMLTERADDGRFGAPGFTVPAVPGPGDWRPQPPAATVPPPPVNDPFAWVRNVRPFLLNSAAQVLTRGPNPLESTKYAKQFNEVKELGSATSPTRTAEQTTLAFFYTDHPVALWNRTFRPIAEGRGLSLPQEARLFAMLNMAGADGLIGCWWDKEYHSFWRPITAIQLAYKDGNLIPTPPYPDHPSGYNCIAGAFMNTARIFFHDESFPFTVHSNAVGAGPDRTYAQFGDVLKDTIDARVYLGIHFRAPDVQGANLGRHVARWGANHFFQRVEY
jgi:hypothetical protein